MRLPALITGRVLAWHHSLRPVAMLVLVVLSCVCATFSQALSNTLGNADSLLSDFLLAAVTFVMLVVGLVS